MLSWVELIPPIPWQRFRSGRVHEQMFSKTNIGSQERAKKNPKRSPDSKKVAKPSGKVDCRRDYPPPALVRCSNFPPKTPHFLIFTATVSRQKNQDNEIEMLWEN